MLKKMLKGILAIATVCAMSTAAFADTNMGAWIGTQIASRDGALVQNYYGKITATITGEKVTAGTETSYMSNLVSVLAAVPGGYDPVNLNNTYVTYKFNDTIDVSLGQISYGATWGFTSLGSWCMGCTYKGNKYSDITGTGIFSNTGVHSSIKLAEVINIYVGMLEDTAGVALATPYVWVSGNAGPLAYAAGFKSGTGVAGGVGLDIGDSMHLGVDVNMPSAVGSAMAYGATFKFIDLGPGTLAAGASMSGTAMAYALNYQISLEPGKYFDVYYNAVGTGNEMGVSLFAMF